MLNLLVFSVRKIYTELREMVKYYFADFVPFTDIPPKNFLQKVLKMVFFAQKTPVFGPKNRLWIWGVPPLPLYGQKFWHKGGYGFGGYPPPPFTDKIRKVVFDHLPKALQCCMVVLLFSLCFFFMRV